MDKRRNNRGTIGNKGGRKSKSEEQQLIEKLTPMSKTAHEQLSKSIKEGEQWAIKLWFEYFYGKPRQAMDITSDGEAILQPITGVNIIQDGANEQSSTEAD